MHTGHRVEHAVHLFFGQHRGQASGLFGAQGIAGQDDVSPQHVAIEKEQGPESLILGRSGNIFVNGQVREKGRDLGCAHVLRACLS